MIPYPIRMIHLSKITCVCRTASVAALTNTAPEDLNTAMEGLSEALEDLYVKLHHFSETCVCTNASAFQKKLSGLR